MKLVLIAAEHEEMRRIIGSKVRELHHCPLFCSSAQLALDFLKENPEISLLITENNLADISGKPLINSIREDNSLSKLPVIIVAQALKYSDISELLEAGATYFLSKPIKLADLERYIKSLFPS